MPMTDSVALSKSFFKAAQNPRAWLYSAERLRDAAEAILRHEQQFEVPYFRAYAAASEEAVAIAYTEGNKSGQAEIACKAPNYPPAQLLYSYAIENVLKGIIVSREPNLAHEDRLNRQLQSHDLVSLSQDAGLEVHVQEEAVLKALSELSVWAGRYPVAVRRTDNFGGKSADELLDWGSQNPLVRQFFDRSVASLERKVGKSRVSHGAVVVFRQPGT
jgi:hypothetical protein